MHTSTLSRLRMGNSNNLLSVVWQSRGGELSGADLFSDALEEGRQPQQTTFLRGLPFMTQVRLFFTDHILLCSKWRRKDAPTQIINSRLLSLTVYFWMNAFLPTNSQRKSPFMNEFLFTFVASEWLHLQLQLKEVQYERFSFGLCHFFE